MIFSDVKSPNPTSPNFSELLNFAQYLFQIEVVLPVLAYECFDLTSFCTFFSDTYPLQLYLDERGVCGIFHSFIWTTYRFCSFTLLWLEIWKKIVFGHRIHSDKFRFKIHIFQNSHFLKFTFFKIHIFQNSHFLKFTFFKIHIFSKFTFFKIHIF